MKKLFALAALSAVAATAIMASNPGDTLTKDELAKVVAGNKLLQLNKKLVPTKAKDLDSVYFIQFTAPGGRKIDGFLDKKTGALYMGGGYDKNGIRISFPLNKKIVDEAVAFKMGNGPKQLYVITDPECPYCRKFEKEAKGKLDDYTVNIILFPLSFHKQAKPMSAYILAGKDNAEKAERFKKTLGGDNSYQSEKGDMTTLNEYLKKSRAAVSELGVSGTPTFFVIDDNGKLKKTSWRKLIGR